MIKQDKATDDAGGGGGIPKETPPTEPKAETPPKASGDNLDEYGYEKVPDADGKKDEVAPKAEAKVEEIKDPATGYGKDPIVAKEEEAAAPPKEEVKVDLGYEVDAKDLSPEDAIKLKEFAKANSLTKEAAQALIDMKKSEIDSLKQADIQYQKQQEKAINDTKVAWDKELRTHPTFGGDKFAHNVQQAEKVLSEFMGETKKVLTERASMLPPYVMRDLAKLAEHLYGTEKLVQGEQGSPKVEEKETDHLDFYK